MKRDRTAGGAVLGWLGVVAFQLSLASCAVPGKAEDFRWSLDVPATVDRGGDLVFQVHSVSAAGETVDGVTYHYLILWTGGSSNPLRHSGRTGTPESTRARVSVGPATLVITCEDQTGKQVKVAEKSFEVK
jgi:hypothetical protein